MDYKNLWGKGHNALFACTINNQYLLYFAPSLEKWMSDLNFMIENDILKKDSFGKCTPFLNLERIFEK
jgi:hypothetical protein